VCSFSFYLYICLCTVACCCWLRLYGNVAYLCSTVIECSWIEIPFSCSVLLCYPLEMHSEKKQAHGLSVCWFLSNKQVEHFMHRVSRDTYFSRCKQANTLLRSVICRDNKARCSVYSGHTVHNRAHICSSIRGAHMRRISRHDCNPNVHFLNVVKKPWGSLSLKCGVLKSSYVIS
jgi:hypothetical protein